MMGKIKLDDETPFGKILIEESEKPNAAAIFVNANRFGNRLVDDKFRRDEPRAAIRAKPVKTSNKSFPTKPFRSKSV